MPQIKELGFSPCALSSRSDQTSVFFRSLFSPCSGRPRKRLNARALAAGGMPEIVLLLEIKSQARFIAKGVSQA